MIYAGVVLCCICPMLFFFFKWRRDKEAELDHYGGGSGECSIDSRCDTETEIYTE